MGGAQGPASMALPTAKHVRGCNCRKSRCIKKYCECFFNGVYCGENCQCEGCQNTAEFAGAHAARAAARKKGGGSKVGAGAGGQRGGPSPVPTTPVPMAANAHGQAAGSFGAEQAGRMLPPPPPDMGMA